MATDDLYAPLGLDRPAKSPPRRAAPWGWLALGGLGVAIFALVAFSLATDDGMGGRPYAEVVIQSDPPPAEPPVLPPLASAPSQPASPVLRSGAPPKSSGAAIFDLDADARPATSGPLVLKVPQGTEQSVVQQDTRDISRQPLGLSLTPAPDPRLVEKGRHGPLPRIGADGARPSEVYARPLVSVASLKAGAPRIALVVGGMGLNARATRLAIETLPGAVTLGFAPYGADLDRQAAEAREAGHELLLQTPMEPIDKSAIPGPHTLLSGAEPAQNLDGLRWHMSRLTGYVGIANFLGGRFMAREPDFAPVIREIAGRGLLFLDDGSSPQSLAPGIAAAAGLPFVRADVVLDANPRPEAIEAALGRLEAMSRAKGAATGYAAGLPGAMEAVARFARGLERRGVALVPLSALASREPASAGLAR